jgi:hypothetical protein
VWAEGVRSLIVFAPSNDLSETVALLLLEDSLRSTPQSLVGANLRLHTSHVKSEVDQLFTHSVLFSDRVYAKASPDALC